MTANGCQVYFLGDRNVLEWIVVTFAQPVKTANMARLFALNRQDGKLWIVSEQSWRPLPV